MASLELYFIEQMEKNTLAPNEKEFMKTILQSIKANKIPFNINAQDKYGNTVLHHAVGNGHTEFFDIFAEFSPDLTIQNNGGLTPFHCAFPSKDTEAAIFIALQQLKLLANIEKPKNLWEMKNESNQTPLFYAIKNKNIVGIKKLLEMGVDPNTTDKFGRTPLLYACLHGKKETVELLLSFNANPNIPATQSSNMIKLNDLPLHVAIKNKHKELIEFLIKNGFAIGKSLPEEILKIDLNLDYAILLDATINDKPITSETKNFGCAITNFTQLTDYVKQLKRIKALYLNYVAGRAEEIDINTEKKYLNAFLARLDIHHHESQSNAKMVVRAIKNSKTKPALLKDLFSIISAEFGKLVRERNANDLSLIENVFSFPRATIFEQILAASTSMQNFKIDENYIRELEKSIMDFNNNLFSKISYLINYNENFSNEKEQILSPAAASLEIVDQWKSQFFREPVLSKNLNTENKIQDSGINQLVLANNINVLKDWKNTLDHYIQELTSSFNDSSTKQYQRRTRILMTMFVLLGVVGLVVFIAGLVELVSAPCENNDNQNGTNYNNASNNDMLSLMPSNCDLSIPTLGSLIGTGTSALIAGIMGALISWCMERSQTSSATRITGSELLASNYLDVKNKLQAVSLLLGINLSRGAIQELIRKMQDKNIQLKDALANLTSLSEEFSNLINNLTALQLQGNTSSLDEKSAELCELDLSGYSRNGLFGLPLVTSITTDTVISIEDVTNEKPLNERKQEVNNGNSSEEEEPLLKKDKTTSLNYGT